MGLSITADGHGNRSLHVHNTQLGDLNSDGHIDQNDALLHFGHSNFLPGNSLDGEVNYVQFADGQSVLILVDTAHIPESFDLSSALSNLGVNTIPEHPAGDYNKDGAVDAADYVMWRDTLGLTAHLAADGDRNNRIDHGDYGVWRAHFGETVATAAVLAADSSNAAVPEPATLLLGMLAGLIVLTLRRCRCH